MGWCRIILPVQTRRVLVRDELFPILKSIFHRRNVASISPLCRYYYDRCLDELNSLASLVQAFTPRALYGMFMTANHPHSFRVPLTKSKLHSDSFFYVTFWKKLLKLCFPDNYNLPFRGQPI